MNRGTSICFVKQVILCPHLARLTGQCSKSTKDDNWLWQHAWHWAMLWPLGSRPVLLQAPPVTHTCSTDNVQIIPINIYIVSPVQPDSGNTTCIALLNVTV